jgi:ELWxxDGT repeat protein
MMLAISGTADAAVPASVAPAVASGSPAVESASPAATSASPGVASGTATLVRDIDPTGDSDPLHLTRFRSRVVFSARDDVYGRELWISTDSSAEQLRDIAPGSAGSNPEGMTVVGSTLYFSADDQVHGRELWKTDGTTSGTKRVRDIRPGALGSAPRGLTSYHHKVFFIASDGAHGRSVWKSDGTPTGTKRVGGTGPSASAQVQPIVFQDRLFYGGDGTGYGLWSTDGTRAGTHHLSGSRPVRLVSTTSDVFFPGDPRTAPGSDATLPHLWASDGTRTGTVRLGGFEGDLGSLVAFEGHADYVSIAAIAPRLYTSAGTAGTTGPVLPKVAADGNRPMTTSGARLFLSRGGALAISDGTGPGTTVLGDPSSGWTAVVDVVQLGDRWYFPAGQLVGDADDQIPDLELWQTDGTPGGTTIAATIDPSDHGTVGALVMAGGSVWFTASDGIHGQELYRYQP